MRTDLPTNYQELLDYCLETPRLVVILRGVPGSGKSTLAQKITREWHSTHQIYMSPKRLSVSADDYFTSPPDERGLSTYNFDPKQLPQAHHECFRHFIAKMHAVRDFTYRDLIFVDNTNTRAVEIAPYHLAGSAYGYEVLIVTIEADMDAARRNVHAVPDTALEAMQSVIASELANIPPWWKHVTIRANQF